MISYFPYDDPRPAQREALARIKNAFENQGKRVFVLDAPTGCGKSAIAIAASRFYGSAFITSPQNMQVRQYERNDKLPTVKGKANYTCSAFPFHKYPRQTGCDCIDPDTCDCPTFNDCERADELDLETHREVCTDYIPNRIAFWRGPISCTNLDFLYWAQCLEDIECVPHRRLIVIDECHNLEETLIKFGRVQMSPANCKRVGLSADHFRSIPGNYHHVAEKRLQEFQGAVAAKSKELGIKEQRAFDRKSQSVAVTLASGDWMFWTDERNNFVICPLSARQQAKRLLSMADKILFMSATIVGPEPFLRGLGLSLNDAARWQANNSVSVERRTVFYQPVGSMARDSYQKSLPQVVNECAQVLDRYRDKKGLILCASYTLQQDLARGLGRFSQRLITHTPKDREQAIRRHCESPEPTVLLGVAMTEGLDLKGNLARFLIIPKLPYPSLADPYIKARTDRDRSWYARRTALAIVQGAGRVVRSDDDFADTYILDSCFSAFLKQNEALFPLWFLDAVEVKGKKRAGGGVRDEQSRSGAREA